MIAFVEGSLESIETDSVVLNVGGMGYRVFTPITQELLTHAPGETMRFYTYLKVSEDAMSLYGFTNQEALSVFKMLINVNSVGPKSALAFFSTLSLDELVKAVATEDAKKLTSVPSIGAKTAARIILDLKDKLGTGLTAIQPEKMAESFAGKVETPVQKDTITALVNLGYNAKEAEKAVLMATEHNPEKANDSGALLGAALRYI